MAPVSTLERVTFECARCEGTIDRSSRPRTCPHCQAKGVVVAKYGPEASEAEAELLLSARDRRFESSDVPAAAPNERD